MIKNRITVLVMAFAVGACGNTYVRLPQASGPNDIPRRRTEAYLNWIHKDLQRLYFDSTFNGVDLEAEQARARQRMQGVQDESTLHAIVHQYLSSLRDSHTYFVPPGTIDTFDYGFELKFFGEQCLVTDIKTGSDAEKVGLKRGDEVILFDAVRPERASFGNLMYDYNVLRPRSTVSLMVQSSDGRVRQLRIQTRVERPPSGVWNPLSMHPWLAKKLKEEADSMRVASTHRFTTLEGKVAVWKMPAFQYRDRNIDKAVEAVTGAQTLILDLRGNGGGAVEGLRRLVAGLFPSPVTIGTMHERSKTEVLKTQPSARVFKGRLLVLVDSETGSAAEVFARLVQLENRGTVIGDRTAGAVRVSQLHTYREFAASITMAEFLMPDHESLEGVGVTPNELAILRSYDLVEGTDGVLAYALSIAGVEMDPAAAGRLFEN